MKHCSEHCTGIQVDPWERWVLRASVSGQPSNAWHMWGSPIVVKTSSTVCWHQRYLPNCSSYEWFINFTYRPRGHPSHIHRCIHDQVFVIIQRRLTLSTVFIDIRSILFWAKAFVFGLLSNFRASLNLVSLSRCISGGSTGTMEN